MTSIQLSMQSFQERCVGFSKADWRILKQLFIGILATSVLQLHIETEQNSKFSF